MPAVTRVPRSDPPWTRERWPVAWRPMPLPSMAWCLVATPVSADAGHAGHRCAAADPRLMVITVEAHI